MRAHGIITNMVDYITEHNISDIENIVTELGQSKFRAKQLVEWILIKGVESYDAMTNLPKAFRETLKSSYPLKQASIIERRISNDGTRKYVIELADGCLVETVGMPSLKGDDHLSVCFSTQVGCAMACSFCATGKEGLSRNLSSIEMVEQIRIVQDDFGTRVSNAVSMGQGEPFQNYDAVLEALKFLNAKNGFSIGARHITLSTCGIIAGIEKLSNEPEQFTLAVSLHSANQELRDKIMPRCKSQTLTQLKKALLNYVRKTGRRPSLEYTMISGVNDRQSDLDELILFTEGLLCHVNLIPLNNIPSSPFKPSSSKTYKHWVWSLEKHGVETTVRNSRGSDIDGACGQLKNTLLQA